MSEPFRCIGSRHVEKMYGPRMLQIDPVPACCWDDTTSKVTANAALTRPTGGGACRGSRGAARGIVRSTTQRRSHPWQFDLGIADRARAPRAGLVDQPVEASLGESAPPHPNRRPRHSQPLGHRHVRATPAAANTIRLRNASPAALVIGLGLSRAGGLVLRGHFARAAARRAACRAPGPSRQADTQTCVRP